MAKPKFTSCRVAVLSGIFTPNLDC